MNKFLSIILFVVIIISGDRAYSGTITDSEFSSAILASLNDITAKSSGGNPVGTIIAWPVAQNPEDMENWLECDGQAVNQTMYPVLYSIIGAHVPDLRNQFLRGGTSAQAGTYAADTTRSHTHTYQAASGSGGGGYLYVGNDSPVYFSWVVCDGLSQWSNTYIPTGNVSTYTTNTGATGSEETAPKNMRVRYLIRALP